MDGARGAPYKNKAGGERTDEMGETKKGGRDPMRSKGPELPLIEPVTGERHKRTKGGGLGWLLHEGKDLFETKILAFRETGEPIDSRTDRKILDMVAGQARNDKVFLTIHMIRKARQALGYKAFVKQPKPKPEEVGVAHPTNAADIELRPGDKITVDGVVITAAEEKVVGEAVNDVEIAAHDVDVTGAPPSPINKTPRLNLRWDEKVMAEAIEHLSNGTHPENSDQEVVMRAIRSQVEAVTMAASPKLHGLLAMFPDGMKEYMHCVFKVLEALGVQDQDPRAGCFGSWHRQNSAQCKGCAAIQKCFRLSLDAQMKRVEEVHKNDIAGGESLPAISILDDTCLEYRPNPNGVCVIAGCSLRKRPAMRCDLHGKVYPIASLSEGTQKVGARSSGLGSLPNLQEAVPAVQEATATSPVV